VGVLLYANSFDPFILTNLVAVEILIVMYGILFSIRLWALFEHRLDLVMEIVKIV